MTTRILKKEEWKSFFDAISRTGELEQKRAEIEIVSSQIGDQLAAEWIPMLGIVYEIRSDTIEIGLASLTHMIKHPKSIFVEERGIELLSICVTDSDDIQHIVRMRDPLLLPHLKKT